MPLTQCSCHIIYDPTSTQNPTSVKNVTLKNVVVLLNKGNQNLTAVTSLPAMNRHSFAFLITKFKVSNYYV